jgi:type VI secretion system protein ImpI
MRAPQYVTLEVISQLAAQLGSNAVHTFDMQGGRLGRAVDNDWTIDDPYVSRYQAHIGYDNGNFFVALDPEASAPMFINESTTQLRLSENYPLQAGDRIAIDEVLIEVKIHADVRKQPQAESSSHWVEPPSALAGDNVEPNELTYPGIPGVNQRNPYGPDGPFGPSADAPPIYEHPEQHRIVSDDILGVYAPLPDIQKSEIPTGPIDLPEDWYKLKPTTGAPDGGAPISKDSSRQPDNTGPREAAECISATHLQALLRGAGLSGATITPEIMSALGAILRIVVTGSVEILRARTAIRREFRIPVTEVQARRNNPLKFAADADDALHDLFVKHNDAYMSAEEAFAEAFDDLRAEQLAVLKGLRAGYERMLSRFDPKNLEARLESPDKNAVFRGRSKMWDRYQEWFTRETEDRDECFRRFFGDAFGKAYEQDLQSSARMQRQQRDRK